MAKDKKEKKSSKDKKRKREKDREEEEERKRLRAERLAKKVTKHLKKHGGQDETGERFVWGKKIEQQLHQGASMKDLTAKAERERQLERLAEIEKVRKRRDEREAELAAQQEELDLIQRERANQEAAELDKKEELFHLEQAVFRARQRLLEGRPRPIDHLAKTLHLQGQFPMDIGDPAAAFRGLSLSEARELRDDIALFQELDKYDEQHATFWAALAVVAEVEVREAVRQDEIDRARMRGDPLPPHAQLREDGLHGSLDADVKTMLAGKTHGELERMEESITEQLESGEAADPEYWTAVLTRVGVAKAQARVREVHYAILQAHMDRLLGGDGVDVAQAMGWNEEEAEPAKDMTLDEAVALAEESESSSDDEDAAGAQPSRSPERELEAAAEGTLSEEPEEEGSGQWSPPRVDPSTLAGVEIVSEEEDIRRLQLLRSKVRYDSMLRFRTAAVLSQAGAGASEGDRAYQQMVTREGPGGVHPMLKYIADAAPQRGDVAMRSGREPELPDDELVQRFQATASRVMGDINAAGDVAFNGGEIALESQVYWWHEKYRPRKPKYFNRVHTGYEWNKYNQTHYDHDNPPPKVVQGYKFNIFYPDLIDKSKAPTYSTRKDPQADEHGTTCILTFHAGPPYEDIAFRIVNKEWEYSHKKGFKCTFERGILHLYFNFKRQRYRR